MKKTTFSFPLRSTIHLGVLTAFASFGVQANASVVKLTGGDPSGGLTLDPSTVVFSDYSAPAGSGTLSLQGVTFNPIGGDARITESSNAYLLNFAANDTPALADFTNPSNPSTQDTNLLRLVTATSGFPRSLTYGGGSTITLTIGGLTANTTYVVDTLSSLDGYDPRSNTVSYNGGPVADSVSYDRYGIFDIHDQVKSSGTGDLTISYNGDNFFGAIALSNTPEPSSFALIGFGLAGLTLLVWRRRGALKA